MTLHPTDDPAERIRLPATLGNLRRLLRFIDDYGAGVGLDERSRQQVELAADEMDYRRENGLNILTMYKRTKP